MRRLTATFDRWSLPSNWDRGRMEVMDKPILAILSGLIRAGATLE